VDWVHRRVLVALRLQQLNIAFSCSGGFSETHACIRQMYKTAKITKGGIARITLTVCQCAAE